ncbi:uncharacterized protein Ndc80 isoform X2 [Plodia interpunctella]|uniref:uncharacterized protein Ndc80 isoform X2 n=1 Tax=Plodia interpunctella TaxID=58824 RepID=UPI00236858EC|nr:uncharacterized protein LOC128678376 isoform X2 [Plodia interpunctella]
MLPSRYVPGQSSAMRKSRLEGKPSMLPKPRRPGSTERLSVEPRRPSTAGHRSSSAEPPRATFGGGRLSREASATKLPLNGRSRSQQGDRFGQSSMTPLRSSHYASRPTTTPVRTPTEDRARNWQACLDRALSFVTMKDQRPISSVSWQRGESARVQPRLCARALQLMRPLTIARFVDIVGALLTAITRDAKLNNDNYVTKMPHLSKRLLYPGAVSKSWLKAVNTLHAFPHALALISYLLDMLTHIEMPVTDDWLYIGKDDLSRLRRDYLDKCWIRFQDPGHQFEDLNEEYLLNLKALLGNDEEKIVELQEIIKKYEACLEDEAETAAREGETRRAQRRAALAGARRAVAVARRALSADREALLAARSDHTEALRTLDVEIERATIDSQQLKQELESQTMCVTERTKLLDEVDYSNRVLDSKRDLAEQIAKMVLSKETELALWQKKTLSSCVEFKQGLIHLSGQFPDLALSIDEKSVMDVVCQGADGAGVRGAGVVGGGAAAAARGGTRGRARAPRALARRARAPAARSHGGNPRQNIRTQSHHNPRTRIPRNRTGHRNCRSERLVPTVTGDQHKNGGTKEKSRGL